ncbi:MAG: protein-L-isoaspartate(D-aspartate) O-methyltransferase [Brevinematales bacterium]|nr:protein-L-isoaspartate(D-aspartate) O-methyltransferase [Brevinematales bacterium]
MSYEMSLKAMIEHQIVARGVRDPRVLEALSRVPRHLFVPPSLRSQAYEDYPLSIGYGQTISQPYIVALMTEALDVQKDHKVLEIGTGSGYQAAILSLLASMVFTIERIEPLWKQAKENLKDYPHVVCLLGDGYQGWRDEAPFDRILLTAAPPHLPRSLLEQVKIGGKIVAPVGVGYQRLIRYTRTGEKHWQEEYLCDVIFVPMVPSPEYTKDSR